MNERAPAIGVSRLSKRYGAVRALDDVTLAFEEGGVHAVVGENGAGKSTLVRVLAGLARPDSGVMTFAGAPYAPRTPKEARRRGVGLVHQHFMLVPTMTALENAMLGEEAVRGGVLLDRGAARVRFREAADRFALDVDPDARVESMSVGEMQRLEILKVLLDGVRVLLLDEPTAVLTPHEARSLYETVAVLAREGATVVLVTHRLREVVEHARDVVVMRRGHVVATRAVAETSEDDLARLLVGREPAALDASPRAGPGEVVVRLAGVSEAARTGAARQGAVRPGAARLAGIDLEVRAGEIVAIAGVAGNGQQELAEIVAGLRPFRGEATLAGASLRGRSPAAIRALGFALVPGDRQVEGLIPSMSAAENLLLGKQRDPRFARRGVQRRRAIGAFAAERLARFEIVPPDPDAPVASYSGGNQPQLVFARESEGAPRLLLAVNPTRGVDVAAAERIHATLVALRDGGAGVLLVSADLAEVLQLADRIVVLVQGRVRAEFARGAADEEALGLAMTAGAAAAVAAPAAAATGAAAATP